MHSTEASRCRRNVQSKTEAQRATPQVGQARPTIDLGQVFQHLRHTKDIHEACTSEIDFRLAFRGCPLSSSGLCNVQQTNYNVTSCMNLSGKADGKSPCASRLHHTVGCAGKLRVMCASTQGACASPSKSLQGIADDLHCSFTRLRDVELPQADQPRHQREKLEFIRGSPDAQR